MDIADYSAVSAFAAALPAPPTEAALMDQMDQRRPNKAEDQRQGVFVSDFLTVKLGFGCDIIGHGKGSDGTV